MRLENNELDKVVYNEELRDYLPKKMIDIHTHLWRKKDVGVIPVNSNAPIRWPSLVADENTIEDLKETYKIMFPDKDVQALMFAMTTKDRVLLDKRNEYVRDSAEKTGFPALYFSHPEETAQEIEEKILKGGFLGTKSYLSLANPSIEPKDVRIFDFFPHHQLKKLDEMGAIVMCHIPRSLRFRDPQNLADIKEIATKYQNLKFIVAHIGRAYIPSDLGNALEYLSDCKNLLYDFCANTSDYVMQKTLESVGSKRLMFGSDLPILRMKMKRIEDNGIYVNLVPPNIYGDVSYDKNMRVVSEEEGSKLTYFMYEEIRAMKKATTNLGMGKEDIENLFYNNANELLKNTRKILYGRV